jgi:hypothetical protein
VSLRVVDPDGVSWEVERVWFPRPEWSRGSPDPGDDVIEDAGEALSWGGLLEDSWWGTVLVLFESILVALLFFVFLPLVIAVLGLLVALAVFGTRLLSISPWTVTAVSSRARLEWRVIGTLRSARAMREVAAGLERGDAWPMVDGTLPVVLESTAVARGSLPPTRIT